MRDERASEDVDVEAEVDAHAAKSVYRYLRTCFLLRCRMQGWVLDGEKKLGVVGQFPRATGPGTGTRSEAVATVETAAAADEVIFGARALI
jgi:hypothetical protein